jgi:hypothetical protein
MTTPSPSLHNYAETMYSIHCTCTGKAAFSEIENQNIRDFVSEKKDNIKFFNTIHSYSQLVSANLSVFIQNMGQDRAILFSFKRVEQRSR